MVPRSLSIMMYIEVRIRCSQPTSRGFSGSLPAFLQIVRKKAGNPPPNGYAPAGGDARDAALVRASVISR
jgi:hypothetical protein